MALDSTPADAPRVAGRPADPRTGFESSSWDPHRGFATPPPDPRGPTSRQWWIAAILLATTFFTATTMGAFWSLATSTDILTDLPGWTAPATVVAVWTQPWLLLRGLLFSIPLLLILGAHELGHYLVARRYGMRVSPPYFLPAPVALGTLGAFIRLRSAVRNKRELFDVGVSGPIAGFVVLIPFLLVGVALSRPVEPVTHLASAASGSIEVLYVPGWSLAMAAASRLFHGQLPADMLLELHPTALAAWVGLLATSLNLLPLAQLDGGHILYALAGRHQRRLALPLWTCLLVAGWWWSGWWLWAFIVLVLGLVHPPVRDESVPLDRRRRWIAGLAGLLLLVCFMPQPLELMFLG